MGVVDADGQKASAPVVSPAAAMTAGLLQLQEQALLTRKVRCLHVGNVPGTATPERLRDFVNCLMVRDELVTAPGDSVLKVANPDRIPNAT